MLTGIEVESFEFNKTEDIIKIVTVTEIELRGFTKSPIFLVDQIRSLKALIELKTNYGMI